MHFLSLINIRKNFREIYNDNKLLEKLDTKILKHSVFSLILLMHMEI